MPSYIHSVAEEEILHELAKAIRLQKCFLLIGLGLALSSESREKLSQSHLKELLRRMIQWCVEKKKFGDEQEEQVIEHFQAMLQKEELEKVELKLQEYLISAEQKQQCINDVMMQGQQQVQSIYELLSRILFRAYITTSYDEFLEIAFKNVQEFLELTKFYKNDIEDAVASYREKQPFILKLHGDVAGNSSDMITLSNRFVRSYLPEAIAYPEQLRMLLADEHTLFIGFEKTDPDLGGLKSLINRKNYLNRWLLVPEGHLTEDEAEMFYREDKITILSYGNQVELVRFLQRLYTTSATRQQVNIYTSYADVSQDRRMRKRLQTHFNNIRCHGLDLIWIDGGIKPGENVKTTLEKRLKSADIMLLLVSADYLSFTNESNVEIEIARAAQRDRLGQARVIPIILRPCGWMYVAPFARLAALPLDKVPIELSSKKELVYFQVAEDIKEAIEEWARNH